MKRIERKTENVIMCSSTLGILHTVLVPLTSKRMIRGMERLPYKERLNGVCLSWLRDEMLSCPALEDIQ